MKHTKIKIITGLAVYVAMLWLLPSAGEAQCTASIGPTTFTSVQAAVNTTGAGPATINVSGTCNENVLILERRHNITLNGVGSPTINGTDPTSPTVNVRGRGITIQGFTITGGEHRVLVSRGGAAIIHNNTIDGTGSAGGHGILVNQHSSARITNNTIQNNPRSGVFVHEGSSARIGFVAADDTAASPNTIQVNAENGITVSRSGHTRIVGNLISSNTGDGVRVTRGSHADVSSNTINGNGGDGILVSQNSGANLGEDTGTTIFDSPNSTTVNNGGSGIRCRINSYANGRLGTLNGASDATDIRRGGPDADCVNSLIP